MSNLWGGKSYLDVLDESRRENRENYARRQKLQAEQKQRELDEARKNQKSGLEIAVERATALKEYINDIQAGGVQYQSEVLIALRTISDILCFVLGSGGAKQDGGEQDGG